MTLSSFVEKNKTAIIVATAVIAAGSGVGIYYALNNPSVEVSSSKPDPKPASKKKNKNKKKNKHVNKTTTDGGFTLKKDSEDAPEYPVIGDFAQIAPLTKEAKKNLASQFKSAGNYYFGNKDYDRAIEFYSNAIKCDDSDPIFYSNRAACNNALQDYQKVIEDTTKALEIKNDYIKCFSRRATAYEKLEQYDEACLDFTSSCILSSFQDKNLTAAVDRVLKLNAEKLVRGEYANKPKKLPSPTFITAFLNAFRKREIPASVVEAAPDTGNYKLKLGFDALAQETRESYEQALHLFDDAVKANAEDLALALEYRGTLRFLMDDIEKAEKDIQDSIVMKPAVQAYIMLSSIHMEQGKIESANLDFEDALKIDPESADLYYHRAQVAFLTGDFNAAVRDYEKSLSIDKEFIYTHIQLAVTQYRMQSVSTATASFKKLLTSYPNSSDVHTYYGEILLDQGNMDDALKEFDIAIDLEKKKKVGTMNVLPLINKALAVFQGSNDISKAEDLCRQAYAIDPESDVVLGTLAQICLQQNKIDDAYSFFKKSADIARTDGERIQALSYAGAAQIQLRLVKERPVLRARLTALAAAGLTGA